jgi:hypothetical protein
MSKGYLVEFSTAGTMFVDESAFEIIEAVEAELISAGIGFSELCVGRVDEYPDLADKSDEAWARYRALLEKHRGEPLDDANGETLAIWQDWVCEGPPDEEFPLLIGQHDTHMSPSLELAAVLTKLRDVAADAAVAGFIDGMKARIAAEKDGQKGDQ